MSAAHRLCCSSRRSPATSPRAHRGGYPKRTKVYRVSMGQAPAQLTDEQLAELQRWADGLVEQGADGDLGTFARAIATLREEAERARAGSAGERAGARVELGSLRRRAESVVENGAPDQLRAAARAVLMLCDDIAAQRRRARELQVARRRRALLVVAGTACAGLLVALLSRGGSDALDAAGPASAIVGKRGLSTLAFSVEGDEDDLASTSWRLDGGPVTARVAARDGRIVFLPRRLADGEHTVEVSRPGGLFDDASASWAFTVDTRAPAIRVDDGLARGAARRAVHAARRRGAGLAAAGERHARAAGRAGPLLGAVRARAGADGRADRPRPGRQRHRQQAQGRHRATAASKPRAGGARERRRLGAPRTARRRAESALREDGSTPSSSTSRTSSASSAGAPACRVAAEDRRRAEHVRPRRGREAAARSRSEGDRTARRVPRPCSRRSGRGRTAAGSS